MFGFGKKHEEEEPSLSSEDRTIMLKDAQKTYLREGLRLGMIDEDQYQRAVAKIEEQKQA